MKLKIVIVDFDIPPRAKRWALRIGIPVVVLGVGAVAFATPPTPHSWATNDTLLATDLNGNFTNLTNYAGGLENRIGGLEARVTATDPLLDAGVVLFAQASLSPPYFAPAGSYGDLPGLTVTVSPAQSGYADIFAAGFVVNNGMGGAASGQVSCNFQILVDGTGTSQGQFSVILVPGTATAYAAQTWVARLLPPLTAGTHTIKVQAESVPYSTSAVCNVQTGQLFVTVR